MNFKNERLMMSKKVTRNRAKEWLDESQEDLITKYMFLEHQVKKQKEVIDKSYIKVTHLLDYYNHYKTLPNCIIDELINLQNDLDILKGVSECLED
ncbi:MAG: hypothetical protein Q4E39_05120 [bacterium]|nr:hypothetical protein [bacterium]